MAFAETFGGRLNRMTITDARLRSRSWRPDRDRISQAFDADYSPSLILLFERGRSGKENDAGCMLMLNRLSAAEDDEAIFTLVASIPAEEQSRVAADWWALAAGAGWKAGHGYLMQPPIRDIFYGGFSPTAPSKERTETWKAFDAACVRRTLDPGSFRPVIEGRMLRNVLAQNFLTESLAKVVQERLSKAGRQCGEFASLASDRFLWTVPEIEEQKLAHAALHRLGLVWEPVWLDLASFTPTRWEVLNLHRRP